MNQKFSSKCFINHFLLAFFSVFSLVFGTYSLNVSFGIVPAFGKEQPLAVIYKKKVGFPLTVVNVTFAIGSAHDPAGKEGLTFLMANMLRQGGVNSWKLKDIDLPQRSRAQLDRYFFPLGTDIEVYVAREQVSFRVVFEKRKWKEVLPLLGQMLSQPAWNEEEMNRLKQEQKDFLAHALSLEDQEEIGKAALEWLVYGQNHGYAHHVAGRLDGLDKISKLDLVNFYKSTIMAPHAVIGLAGDWLPEAESFLKSVVTSLIFEKPQGVEPSDFEKSSRRVFIAKVLKRKPKVLLLKGPFDSVGYHFGVPLPVNRSDRRSFPSLFLASQGFGKHRTFVGRLMKVVREERGLNYGTYSYVEEFPNGGQQLMPPTQSYRSQQSFTMWARPTTQENACFLLKQLFDQYEMFSRSGLSNSEFSLTKQHLVGALPLQATGPERQLGFAIDDYFYGRTVNLIEDIQILQRNKVNAEVSKTLSEKLPDVVIVARDPRAIFEQSKTNPCHIHYPEGVVKSLATQKQDSAIANKNLPWDQFEIIERTVEEIVK